MILDSNSERPEIKYPCEWSYKIIGHNLDKLIAAVEESSLNLEYEITPSNVSKNQKYFSLNLKIMVSSEAARDLVYEKLEKHQDIIMVL
ncbi:MAG TPA: DUF493 domain-containing protein [Ignavibacteriaceae bacterium]|nr:DUF493 domain-containing protein [Ignavibacteriaceae bacterium]